MNPDSPKSLVDLFGPLKSAFGLFKRFLTASASERRAFFEDYIEPSFERLEVIHADYLQAFTGALDRLQRRTELEEVVRVLKLDRPRVIAQRRDAKAFLEELILSRQAVWKSDDVQEAFYEYVRSIEAYLNAASPLSPGSTWYTAFIEQFSALVADGRDPYAHAYGSISGYEHRAVQVAMEQLRIAVEEQMPRKRQEVGQAYAALKTLCLT